ncbi:TasA family protein [Streptomyces gamaensis]|uniref:TasA family protein n=1 Tax=Streptomyces gamaensis TaxID=1763542 RepID=A0ABW0Z6V2_9ACTN
MSIRGEKRGKRSARGKRSVAVAGAALLAGVGLASAGGYAAWTSSAEMGTGEFKAGTVNLAADSSGATAFNVGNSNMLPGDTESREVKVTNTGTLAQSVATEYTPRGELAPGLNQKLELCSEDGKSCAPVADPAKVGAFTLRAKESKLLKFVFSLPADADAKYQGKTAKFNVKFTSTGVKNKPTT